MDKAITTKFSIFLSILALLAISFPMSIDARNINKSTVRLKKKKSTTRNSTLDKVMKEVSLQFNVKIDKLKPSTNFRKDLGADDLDQVELIMCFEERFKIAIPDKDVNKLVTIQSSTDYIEQKLQNKKKKSK